MHTAVKMIDVETIQKLIALGADIDWRSNTLTDISYLYVTISINFSDPGLTALEPAIQFSDSTALYLATAMNSFDIVKLLLAAGADYNIPGK